MTIYLLCYCGFGFAAVFLVHLLFAQCEEHVFKHLVIQQKLVMMMTSSSVEQFLQVTLTIRFILLHYYFVHVALFDDELIKSLQLH